ncbi:hypothetical protein [Citrobacter koseri]|uniref:hypothetical protein n=1 Tax=Citrobacter koseri TaxID=545 RepID=UPI0023AAD61F|nr:hypothetical protein [Citrobacter koseri]WEE18640.1 hypothetical protein PX343_06930 [Citrobacter koseri]
MKKSPSWEAGKDYTQQWMIQVGLSVRACLFTTSGSVVSWLLSHSQEKGIPMTKEEKVMFLMRLAVETHNAYRSGQLAAGKSGNFVQDPIDAIERIYEKYEVLLDKKLAE